MDKIYFNPPIAEEHKILSGYAKKKFGNSIRLIKLKESAWGSVFLVSSGKPDRRYILKYSMAKQAIEHEYHALSFLKSKGITHVPQVIAFEKLGAAHVLSLNFISNEESITQKGQLKLARLLAQIHSIQRPPSGKTCLSYAHGLLAEVSCLAEYLHKPQHSSLHKKCERLMLLLHRSIDSHKAHFLAKKTLAFTNGDLADDSIYCSKGEVHIIDWHASGFGDNAWDIARLLANNPETINRKIFLKEYLAHLEDAGFAKRFETYWLLNKAFTLLFFFLKAEWHSFPMQYSSKRFIEENLDVLLK